MRSIDGKIAYGLLLMTGVLIITPGGGFCMVSRNPSFLLALLMFTATTADLTCAQGADAKGKKRSSGRHYFVPPPPAYYPSLAPGDYSNGKVETASKPAAKKKVAEKKYVFTREGYEEPKATRPNPYVTYWGS